MTILKTAARETIAYLVVVFLSRYEKGLFSRPDFLDELARKRLLRRLIEHYLPFEPFFNALQAGSNSRVCVRNFERLTFQKGHCALLCCGAV